MTTTKRRITRGRKGGKNSPFAWRYFMHGEQDKSTLTDAEMWEQSILQSNSRDAETGMTAAETWAKQQPAIMRTWLRKHPGRRPWAWWKYDAPEPRKRQAGTGTPWHECLAACKKNPDFERGLPTLWINKFKQDYYNGVAVDIHGNRIESTHHDGTSRKPGDFAGVALDPDDPPTFEGEPAYLQRLGLLTTDEAERLTPADYEPVALPAKYWPERR